MKKGILSLCALGLLAPVSAEAGWANLWTSRDFTPYYQDGQLPQDTQWDKENWQPQDWVYFHNSDAQDLVNQWYKVGIIKEQYLRGRVPYVEVGLNFYHLSGQDKGRVIATLDHIYQISQKTPATIMLKDGETEEVIGYYTPAAGLILE